MESNTPEVAYELPPFFRAFKNGPVERFFGTDVVPPSIDSQTGVFSRDVVVLPKTGLLVRVFGPIANNPAQKLPLLVYFHGGAFCIGSPFCSTYHNYLTSVVAKANVLAVSVDYRLAPEHPLPAAYEDAWAVLKWVASHVTGPGSETAWPSDRVDFRRVFLAGDSAGANIAHNTALRAGVEGLEGVRLIGLFLVHPDFAGKEGQVEGAWKFACPGTTGSDDPRINPSKDPRLPGLGVEKVLIWVTEKDRMRDRGWFYYETLKKSGWVGEVEITETQGEEHVFHLFNPTCHKAVEMLGRFASFVNQ